ncbi:MAG: cupin domain-containing protein [Solirubrobacterales bacterium]|nr:cupin domain-containing protein [Solirubrobacterales bacterium]
MSSFRRLKAGDQSWRRSNQMGVLNTDLGRQLEATQLGARLWRIEPGQASTRHRHKSTEELYVLLEGIGKLRVGDELLVLEPMDAVAVDPETVRQPFNDTDQDQLWLIVGAPTEHADTTSMDEQLLAWMYPDGPKAMPEELA